jgi:hypothetical protein
VTEFVADAAPFQPLPIYPLRADDAPIASYVVDARKVEGPIARLRLQCRGAPGGWRHHAGRE